MHVIASHLEPNPADSEQNLDLDFSSMREQIELQQAIAAALARDEEDESDESELEDEIAFQDAIENLNLWLERERFNYRRLG